MTDPSAKPVPTLRGGRYAVVGVLGVGSQAETLDAVDKVNGRAVAIKRFQVRGAKSWKDVELAEREASVLSTLSHPNLPEYIEHFEEDGALYLVMTKIEGETLASLRRRRATLSSADIAQFLADADGVLRYLHARSPVIIHRDIKPGNVIRRADGSYAFVDFGSVRDQLKPEGGSTVVGTFGYMAPEQFQGRALPGSDVYAVAATALALITGREPEDLPHRGLGIDVPAALGNAAEPWLVRALAAMLEPDPDKRPRQMSVQPPAARSRAAHESERDPNNRQRGAKRAHAAEGEREWQGPEAWSWFALREQGRAQRRGMREEARRFRRELKAQIRTETRGVKRRARAFARSRRQSLRRAPSRRDGPAAPVLVFALVLALTAARLANWALFRLFLPTLLNVLSWFFGRGLRRAAWRCRDVGALGDDGLERAIAAVRGRPLGWDQQTEFTSDRRAEASEPEAAIEESSWPPRVRIARPRARVDSSPYEEDAEPSGKDNERRRGR